MFQISREFCEKSNISEKHLLQFYNDIDMNSIHFEMDMEMHRKKPSAKFIAGVV